jgi:hypothetical protein
MKPFRSADGTVHAERSGADDCDREDHKVDCGCTSCCLNERLSLDLRSSEAR